jgi:hypothetical protein
MEQPRVDFQFILLDNNNADYVTGKSDRISSSTDWLTALVGMALTSLFGAFFIAFMLRLVSDMLSGGVSNLGNRVIIGLILVAGTAFLASQVIDTLRTILSERRLAREGKIVPGQATGVEVWQIQYMKVQRVSYQFDAPDGQTLTGTTGVTAPTGTVVRGAPLAILWLDDDLHRAL